ncbi:hypothetical protein AB1N83_012634 [Pleurotus pulmonarius]
MTQAMELPICHSKTLCSAVLTVRRTISQKWTFGTQSTLGCCNQGSLQDLRNSTTLCGHPLVQFFCEDSDDKLKPEYASIKVPKPDLSWTRLPPIFVSGTLSTRPSQSSLTLKTLITMLGRPGESSILTQMILLLYFCISSTCPSQPSVWRLR